MHQGIYHSLTEGTSIIIRHGHAEQAKLDFVLYETCIKLLRDALKGTQQRSTRKFVQTYLCARKVLDSDLISRNVFSKCALVADGQQARNGGDTLIALTRDESQRAVQFGVVETEQTTVTTISRDNLA